MVQSNAANNMVPSLTGGISTNTIGSGEVSKGYKPANGINTSGDFSKMSEVEGREQRMPALLED